MATLVGRVGLIVKGAWDSSVAYAYMDVVTYNNSTYIAKQAVPAGTLPTNTTYWELALDADLLQPKTMSSPVTIGGESKTTVEAAVGALEDVKADKTAISSVETTSTAVSAHAVGSYFINASGQFVKTTSAITIGDTIIVKPAVGYNCEVTTIAEVLKTANDNIGDINGSITSILTSLDGAYIKSGGLNSNVSETFEIERCGIMVIVQSGYYGIYVCGTLSEASQIYTEHSNQYVTASSPERGKVTFKNTFAYSARYLWIGK